MLCHACKNEIKLEGPVSRTAECPHCEADAHCCLNCENYDVSAHNRCREPQSEWVSDREKANFCDFFRPNQASQARQLKPSAGDAARSAFENLFKK
jgi:hypothetical protein